MSDPTAEILPIEEAATTVAILYTRCNCSRAVQIPIPMPRTITIELIPLRDQDKSVRTFYAADKKVEIPGPNPRGVAFVYLEGPNPLPRIIFPGWNLGGSKKPGLILP